MYNTIFILHKKEKYVYEYIKTCKTFTMLLSHTSSFSHLRPEEPLVWFLSSYLLATELYLLFFRPASFTQTYICEIHPRCCTVVHSFLLLSRIPLYEYITICTSFHLFLDIWLFFFCYFINKAIVNIPMQVFMYTYVFISQG